MAEFNPAELGTRFEARETLGEGAFGVVLRARDRVRDREVAVKVLGEGDDPAEFLALRHLHHPSIVRVLDLGRTLTGRPWFTMDVVDGLLIHEAARAPDLWAARVARLLEAIAFLHDRGWLHADITANNVLVPSGQPDRVVLLDFGLALKPGEEDAALRGTVGYIAPELLQGQEPSVASDLYSVGVVAALAATGEFVFPPEDPHPGLDGEPPSYWPGPGLPPEARGWLAQMLQRSPAQRPTSAREALASLEAALGHALADPDDAATRIAPTELIGREEIFEDLREVTRAGGVLIVLGDAGAGRTAILRAHLDALRREGHRAWHLELGTDTSRAQRSLRTFLADRVAIEAVPPNPLDFDNPSELGEALRVYEATLAVDLRGAVGDAAGALLVDDLDPATVAGRATLRALEPADPEHGIVITGRSEHRSEFVALLEKRSDPRDRIAPLRPLTVTEVERWLGEALGTVSRADQLARALHLASKGAAGEMVAYTGKLLRARALRPTDRQWQWTADAVDVELEDESSQTLNAKVRTLDVITLVEDALLEADTLAGQGEVAAARRRLGRQAARAERLGASVPLLAEAWVRLADLSAMEGEGEEAASWLQRVRCAEGTSVTRRVWCLVREADALENSGYNREALDLLDEHRDLIAGHGGIDDRGRAGVSRGAALLGMARFDDARRSVDATREDLKGQLSVQLEIGLMLISANSDWHQGRLGHAEGVCRAAAELLPDSEQGRIRASVETTLATSLRLQGRFGDAAVLYVQARDRFRRLGRLLDCARVANNLGIVRYQQGDWLAAIEAWEDFRELVRRADNATELTLAWNNLGCLYRDTGQLDRAEDAFDRSLELARRYRLARTIPMVLGNMAECSAVRGRTSLAEGQYAECISKATELGATDEVVEAWRRVAQMYFDVGDCGTATEAIAKARGVPEAQAAQELRLIDGLEAVLKIQAGDAAGVEEAEAVIEQLDEDNAALEAARLRLRFAYSLVRIDRYAEAEEQVGLAVRVCEPLPARPELARAADLNRLIAEATRNRLDTVTAHYDALQQLTLAISRERDLPTLLETVLERTLELVGEDRGYVLLMDEGGVPKLTVTRQVDEQSIDQQLYASGPSKSVTQRVIETRKPLAVLDIDASESFRDQVSVRDDGVRSIICVPILRRKALLGLIYVDSKSAVGGSADRKASLLMAAADAASVAIENAQLIDALRAKNDSIAIMAHELRTPLSAIVGFASVMLEGGQHDPAEDEEILGIIKREAERTAEMVNRVLQLARMEARDVEPPNEVVDPLHIVVAASDTLKPLAHQAEVTLCADAGEDVPDLLGDADRLVQVAVNLLSNAVKFSPRGGRVEIRAEKAEDGGLILTVTDEGPGVPEDRIDQIFEPYKQAGPKGMRSKGVGLGLAICRQIVRQHRGWIRAENREGGGAIFVVWLPTALATSSELPSA